MHRAGRSTARKDNPKLNCKSPTQSTLYMPKRKTGQNARRAKTQGKPKRIELTRFAIPIKITYKKS